MTRNDQSVEGSEPAKHEDSDPATPEAKATLGDNGQDAPESGTSGNKVLSFLREIVVVVGTALILSLLLKTFLVQAFYIPSESMERTLMINDKILVSQLTPGPIELKRGDIIVFRDPGGWLTNTPAKQQTPLGQATTKALTFLGILPQDAGHHLIKRLVGMPGDRVVCCSKDGWLTVNGEELHETYVPPGVAPSEVRFDIVVPQGRAWVMGDNRNRSSDSRAHAETIENATVPLDLIVGRAVVIMWPWQRWTWLSNHDEIFGTVPGPDPNARKDGAINVTPLGPRSIPVSTKPAVPSGSTP